MITLNELGLKHGTDKASSGHNYCHTYERYLAPLRQEQLVLLEIGVGGEEHLDRGGQSLRMWHDYFPNALVVGVDVYPKQLPEQARIHIYQGSQDDAPFLQDVVNRVGSPQVIVDDGSHHNRLTSQTFDILFPLLKPGGLYICEDVHTSYWKKHYDGDPNPNQGDTTMNFFKRLTDQLNHDVLERRYQTGFAGQLEFVHFYKELVIVKKAAL